jgi:hypothetical protein
MYTGLLIENPITNSGPGDNGDSGGGGKTAICNRLRVGHGGFGFGCGTCRAASEEGCIFGC